MVFILGNLIWNQVGKIISDEGECGYDLDISSNGRDLIIGCPRAKVGGKLDVGAVHLYKLLTDDDQKIMKLKKIAMINGGNEKDKMPAMIVPSSKKPKPSLKME